MQIPNYSIVKLKASSKIQFLLNILVLSMKSNASTDAEKSFGALDLVCGSPPIKLNGITIKAFIIRNNRVFDKFSKYQYNFIAVFIPKHKSS